MSKLNAVHPDRPSAICANSLTFNYIGGGKHLSFSNLSHTAVPNNDVQHGFLLPLSRGQRDVIPSLRSCEEIRTIS